jgi:hypothetical protein
MGMASRRVERTEIGMRVRCFELRLWNRRMRGAFASGAGDIAVRNMTHSFQTAKNNGMRRRWWLMGVLYAINIFFLDAESSAASHPFSRCASFIIPFSLSLFPSSRTRVGLADVHVFDTFHPHAI